MSDLQELLGEGDRRLEAGDSDEALALFEMARAQPGSTRERYALGVSLLRASNATSGWDLYDLHPSRPVDRLDDVERWDGSPCEVLVVLAEQGFGDAIQFLRYVPRIVDRASEVVVAVHDELVDVVLGSRCVADVRLVSKSEALGEAWAGGTRWERLMSLPAWLGTIETWWDGPYLTQRPDDEVGPRVDRTDDELVVGVAWLSTQRDGVPDRSIPPGLLDPLADVPRARLVSIHRSDVTGPLPQGVEDLGISGFVDTVRVIQQCDIVVTCDTVTAHLAPALAVPTLVCLLRDPDWRWGTPTHPTRWYSAAELCFQPAPGAWEAVVTVVANRLYGSTRGRHGVGRR